MADIEPPSFSLGIDLDFQTSDHRLPPHDWRVSDSDPDSPPPSRLRRLRRRPTLTPPAAAVVDQVPNSFDDDIEDFSEEDDDDDKVIAPTDHLLSSSKLPLSGSGVLTRPKESTIHAPKRKQDSSCAPTTSVASNKGKSVFPEFSTSPLRKFQLLDSDSDDPSQFVDVKRKTREIDSSKNIIQKESNHGSRKISCPEKAGPSASTSQNHDLWKNFHVDNNGSVPTPVFDELLEEYYKSGNQNTGVSGSRVLGSSGTGPIIDSVGEFAVVDNLETGGLPCHRYFFHNDHRIQRLVRSRLPYFCPISMSGDARNVPNNASSIDYRSQFCNGNAGNQRAGKEANVGNSSKSSRKRTKKANVQEDSHASGAWIDPKSATNTPKDAGRRRVRADGQSAGRWFTGDNGKKVYVTRTGKELTGRFAYMQYNKDNGASKKSRTKRPSKKKR